MATISVRSAVLQDEVYPYRRLLGAILLEAVDDVLHGDRLRDRQDALRFLRDEGVQALYNSSLSLPPRLWGAFVGGLKSNSGSITR